MLQWYVVKITARFIDFRASILWFPIYNEDQTVIFSHAKNVEQSTF